MSKAKKNRRTRTPHCDCTCPFWGKPNDQIYVVQCECGRKEYACGYCLEAGRVTCCLECGKGKHDPQRN